MQALTRRRRDLIGGVLTTLLGMAAVVQGRTYDVGSFARMGPGFFPVGLGSLLVVLGAALVVGATMSRRGEETTAFRPEWRGWFCVVASLIVFVVLGRYGGLVPATFAIVFIAALGDRENSWLHALLLALAMVAVAVIVFSWALRIQFPLFAWGHA